MTLSRSCDWKDLQWDWRLEDRAWRRTISKRRKRITSQIL